MSTAAHSAPPSFQLSPAASFAAGLIQQRFHALLMDMATLAEREGLSAPEQDAQNFPDRLALAMSYFEPQIKDVFTWLFRSRETSNFTYPLAESNKDYLASFVSIVATVKHETARAYIDELCLDTTLRAHVLKIADTGQHYMDIDRTFDFGRRLGWYAIVRAVKPRLVVETGVEQGLGSLVLCAALMRNAREGAPGKYLGTDINPQAGYLLQGAYQEHGRILYGDSIASLSTLHEKIDVFINDSDHSAEYEEREYFTVADKLTEHSVILGDNSHVTDKLFRFAQRSGRRFLFFREKPAQHWYPGAGIGAAY